MRWVAAHTWALRSRLYVRLLGREDIGRLIRAARQTRARWVWLRKSGEIEFREARYAEMIEMKPTRLCGWEK